MISYLCTSPEPKIKGTDALYNEIDFLKYHFNGSCTTLPPSNDPKSNVPILLYGFHRFRKILKLEKSVEVNHIFASSIFHLPIVYFLKKPIIYTVSASLGEDFHLPPKIFLNRIKYFIVSNEIDFQKLKNRAIKNIRIIKTGIDISHIKSNKLSLDGKLHLLMASAPWELNQFHTKGVMLILEALQKSDDLHVTFLWRNVLSRRMKELVKEYGVGSKITFVNEFVNIDEQLKGVHGTILVTNDGSLVKSLPHSLIESIVAGKPVILSDKIPMHKFVTDNNCGLVLNEFTSDSLVKVITSFKRQYETLRNSTLDFDEKVFSIKRYFEDYRALCKTIINKPLPGIAESTPSVSVNISHSFESKSSGSSSQS